MILYRSIIYFYVFCKVALIHFGIYTHKSMTSYSFDQAFFFFVIVLYIPALIILILLRKILSSKLLSSSASSCKKCKRWYQLDEKNEFFLSSFTERLGYTEYLYEVYNDCIRKKLESKCNASFSSSSLSSLSKSKLNKKKKKRNKHQNGIIIQQSITDFMKSVENSFHLKASNGNNRSSPDFFLKEKNTLLEDPINSSSSDEDSNDIEMNYMK